MMPLRKYFALTLIAFLSGQLTAQNNPDLPKNYAISDVYFIDYLGFIKPNLAVVPSNGGIFSPNWHSWYFKTQDTILSVEPSYIDTSLVMTRTSRNLFEIIKVPLNDVTRKPTPLVLTKGFIFYTVPSNFISDLNFYVVGYNNKFNICRLYNHKVDTIFASDSMIGQLEVVDKSTLLFCSGNKLMIRRQEEKPFVLFDAGEYRIHGFATDNKGSIYVSTDPGIIKIEKFSELSILSGETLRGKLRYFAEKLYLLNAANRTLSVIPLASLSFARLSPTDQTKQEKPSDMTTPVVLTNTYIVKLVNAQTSDEKIIDIINRSTVNFNTSVDSMIFLSGSNVSSAVILAMRNAMKTKGTDAVVPLVKPASGQAIENKLPDQNVPVATPDNLTTGRFYIIVGSYPTEEKAAEAVAELRTKGFPGSEVVGKSSSGSFRIASKSYNTIDEATKDLADARQKLNPSAWIYEKK